MDAMTYSNPCMHAEIPNWPMGGSKRGVATFSIETRAGKGQRAVRITECNGKLSAPKVRTFAKQARIVDGSDGKTYVVELSSYGFISVMRSDMKLSAEDAIWPEDARFESMLALFDVES